MSRAVLQAPIGPLTLEAGGAGLRAIWFGERVALTEASPEEHAVLHATRVQLEEYFAGERRSFDLPLDVSRGTPFQREAWLALAHIPYGMTTTYGEQARRLGRADAARAVGAANGRNPLPIVLPCHRVIGAGGALTGFGGGLPTKRALLDLEQGVLPIALQEVRPLVPGARKRVNPPASQGDAHLAALALEHGATVVSFDRDFARFEGLALLRPD